MLYGPDGHPVRARRRHRGRRVRFAGLSVGERHAPDRPEVRLPVSGPSPGENPGEILVQELPGRARYGPAGPELPRPTAPLPTGPAGNDPAGPPRGFPPRGWLPGYPPRGGRLDAYPRGWGEWVPFWTRAARVRAASCSTSEHSPRGPSTTIALRGIRLGS